MNSGSWQKLTEDFLIAKIVIEVPHGIKGSVFRQVRRPQNLLYYCLQGSRDYINPQGQTFLSSHPGDVMIMPIFSTYDSLVASEQEAKGYGVMFNLYDRNGGEIILGEEPEILLRDRNSFYADRFRDLYDLRLHGGFSQVLIKAKLYDLLYLLGSRDMLAEADRQPRSLLPAVRYMESHLQQNCSIEQLAQICFMSRSTFHRRFQAEYRCSPIAWHLQMRIRKSRELLSTGLYSVQQVAEIMGFCDTYYFSRMFTKYTGLHAKDCRFGPGQGGSNDVTMR